MTGVKSYDCAAETKYLIAQGGRKMQFDTASQNKDILMAY